MHFIILRLWAMTVKHVSFAFQAAIVQRHIVIAGLDWTGLDWTGLD